MDHVFVFVQAEEPKGKRERERERERPFCTEAHVTSVLPRLITVLSYLAHIYRRWVVDRSASFSLVHQTVPISEISGHGGQMASGCMSCQSIVSRQQKVSKGACPKG